MIDTTKLRNDVISLALRGELTQQNEKENALDLLSRISAKETIEEHELLPYQIPSNWCWAKIKNVYTINPKVEADDNKEAAFIPMEMISPGYGRRFSYQLQTWKSASKNHTKFQDGDVAFAKISPCFENRKSFIAEDLPNGIGGGTTELIILRQENMLAEYTYLLILDSRFIRCGSSSYTGVVGQQRIKAEAYKEYLIPIPPIEEQQRIVDKVKTIFECIDLIDDLQTQYSSDLKVLKNKLIDAAIRGKITEQLLQDGTAEELVEQIIAEKNHIPKVKKEKAIDDIKEETPFEIPGTWKWVRLQDIAQYMQRGKSPKYSDTKKYPVISQKCNQWSGIDYEVAKFVDEDSIAGYSEDRVLQDGDLIINATGTGTLGRCGVYYQAENRFGWAVVDSHVTVVRFNRERILPEYINLFWKSSHVQNVIESQATGSTNQKELGLGLLQAYPIPLPPYNEQIRIVDFINRVTEQLQV